MVKDVKGCFEERRWHSGVCFENLDVGKEVRILSYYDSSGFTLAHDLMLRNIIRDPKSSRISMRSNLFIRLLARAEKWSAISALCSIGNTMVWRVSFLKVPTSTEITSGVYGIQISVNPILLETRYNCKHYKPVDYI